jgi:O-antigen/teichoic acid export membrane protein
LTLNIVFLAAFGLGVQGVFLSTLAANLVIGSVVTALIVRRVGVGVSRPAAWSLLRYGLPLVGTQFATFFVTYGDRYFLRVSADVTTVGLYSLAYQFGFIVSSVGFGPFSMIWEPTRFQIANHPNRDELYSRAFMLMNVFLLIVTLATSLYVRDFIIVMSDKAYHSAYLIVPVILVAYVLQSWSFFHEVGILVRERTGYVTLANWVAAVVALVGYVVLVPKWLGWGAAVTTVLAFLTRWIITYGVAQRLLHVRYEWAPVWRLVALTTLCALAGLALPHPDVPISLAMRTALFGGYLWALWHIGVLRPQEKDRIVTVLRSPGSALRSVMN